MAFHVSPGLYWSEKDLSNYIPALSSTQVGIVTTATKGNINDKELITSKEQLIKTFGYPSENHLGLWSAMNYLEEGNQCWIVRAESSVSPAEYAYAPLVDILGNDIELKSITTGSFYNSIKVAVDHSNPIRVITTVDNALVLGDVAGPWTLSIQGKELISTASVSILVDGKVVLSDSNTKTPGVLIAKAVDGVGFTGTVNYHTGAISVTSAVNDIRAKVITLRYSYNTYFAMISYKSIGQKRFVLEEFKNLSLDISSERYYKKVLTRSFIYSMIELGDVMPAAGNYQFSGGTDGTDNIEDSDYIGSNLGVSKTGLQIFGSPQEIDLNAIAIPGLTSDASIQALVSMAEGRADCIAIIDPPIGMSPEDIVDWVNGVNTYEDRNIINSSYATIFYPWVLMNDVYNNKKIFVPPSGFVMAAFAANDRENNVWWAPVGTNVPSMKNVYGVERSLTRGEMDFIYENRINPISGIGGAGIMLQGQKTAQLYSSSRDRINVRRLLNYVEKAITTALQPIIFKPLLESTFNRVELLVQPYLNGLVSAGAFYQARIICNKTFNTNETINRNELYINIYLQPVKTAEIIMVNFILQETGATIDESIGKEFIQY